MKILLLADINSAHIQKWTIALSQNDFEVAVFSISKSTYDWYSKYNISLLNKPVINTNTFKPELVFKINYLSLIPSLKKAIELFNPDIVHAHYATSYGLLGALCGFHPFIISAWGSDVMDFPNRSFLHKMILKYNFKKADSICATSDSLIKEIKKLTKKNIHKIPFGIDTNYFKPKIVANIFPSPVIVIGTVKSLETIYGIDILIKAFKKVSDVNVLVPLKLLIVGQGSKEKEYKLLVEQLAISDKVVFTGKIEHSKVVDYHNMIDIFINASRNESFGVAVLEASACEKSVIASNVGGLKEVVEDGNTGFLVELEDIDALATVMEKLIKDEKLRKAMGVKGRMFVKDNFNFKNNMDAAIALYNQL